MEILEETAVSNRALVVPDKILVATDLADTDYLIPHAMAQARACGAALTLVHVIPPAEVIPLDATAIPYMDEAAMQEEARQTLEGVASRVRDSGIPCDVVVVPGYPRHRIAAIAGDIKAGRVLTGTHGRRHLKRILLGSVAHEILRTVDVPVCTIGPHAHEASSFGAPRRILHPVSLCPGYAESAAIAMEMAQFYRAEITLLHVLSADTETQEDAARVVGWTRSQLKQIIPAETSARATVQVTTGDVVDKVLEVSAEMNSDLIVLGVNADLSIWPVRGDDTVYSIIARAKSPVLSIRHRADKES